MTDEQLIGMAKGRGLHDAEIALFFGRAVEWAANAEERERFDAANKARQAWRFYCLAHDMELREAHMSRSEAWRLANDLDEACRQLLGLTAGEAERGTSAI